MLGGVVGELYRREQVLLLAYLAVRPALRGRGIGTALLKYAAAHWYASPDVGLAVGELHDPRRWPNVAGEDAARRLHFYERFGARVLDVPFVQPALANGRARIPGFLLIALYVDPAVVVHVDGESVRADLVSRFVRRYDEEPKVPTSLGIRSSLGCSLSSTACRPSRYCPRGARTRSASSVTVWTVTSPHNLRAGRLATARFQLFNGSDGASTRERHHIEIRAGRLPRGF